ncbi:unnamed protein product [Ilex paraguariensis]|uniref:Uncharacterized protein n=1 Tax=Ilex paraguariensis TaxID=185542 RepID=A0ABC8V4K1_9AQUA
MESFDYLECIDCTPLYIDVEWDPVLAALQAAQERSQITASDLEAGSSNHHQAQEQAIPVSANEANSADEKPLETELVLNVTDSEIAEALAVLPELPKHLHGDGQRLPAPEMNRILETMLEYHKAQPLDPISKKDYNVAKILLMLDDSSPLEADEALRLEDGEHAEPEAPSQNPRKRCGRSPKVHPNLKATKRRTKKMVLADNINYQKDE